MSRVVSIRTTQKICPIRGHAGHGKVCGTPGYGWSGPDATEVLFSVDGASWSRWEPNEFGLGGTRDFPEEHMGDVSVVGVGDDFVVLQHQIWGEETQSFTRTLWVGTIE